MTEDRGAAWQLCLAVLGIPGWPATLSAVTIDAPLTLARRFRRLLPASGAGFSAILVRVSLVIEAQVVPPCSVFGPSVRSSRPAMP